MKNKAIMFTGRNDEGDWEQITTLKEIARIEHRVERGRKQNANLYLKGPYNRDKLIHFVIKESEYYRIRQIMVDNGLMVIKEVVESAVVKICKK